MGVDPIKNVYTDTSSIYRFSWGTYSGALQDGAAQGPNGAVYWTITLTDDYGDAWTTSAVTTYYDAQSACADNTDVSCTSVPNWYNDGSTAFADTSALIQDDVDSAMFLESNIAEQVNASVQALPNDFVRNSYVWFADNTGVNSGLIYPAYSTPDSGSDDPLDCQTAFCGTLSSRNGPSAFVNDVSYRFPLWTDTGDNAFDAYSNCDDGKLCIFLKLDDPVNGRTVTVDYKFQTDLDGANSLSSENSQSTYDDGYDGLVEIDEVGSSRVWRDDIDGTPSIEYDSQTTKHVCSKRGMCDHDTGLCSCFDGYSGFRCDKRTSTGNY